MNTTQSLYGTTYGGSAPENYERYFVPAIGGPLAASLVEEAALQRGERVLDVACGTGAVTRLAAERVGGRGAVAGLDLNPGMLAVARTVPATGAKIQWYETSAEAMPLPDDAFDVVFCQLGLMFIPDKAAAIREMRRVLTPGGRLLVSTPAPSAFFQVFEQAIAAHVSADAAAFVGTVFSLHDVDAIEALFRGPGLRDVRVRVDTHTLHLPPPLEFLWQYVHLTPLSPLVQGIGSARIAELERDIANGWRPWLHGDGMRYEQPVVVTTARK
jgi:SAM-dependent methyltransferase